MDIDLFLDILRFDSTSGNERPLAEFLASALSGLGCEAELLCEDGDASAPANLYAKWGEPKVVFCTHLDTVPPYIPPTVETGPDGAAIGVRGRGSCDAKGQALAMLTACRRLAQAGETGFGLLLLYGEETGSYGAKAMASHPGAEYVVVGEPTDNKMAEASKGTKAFDVEIRGKAFHSGYPQYGRSAVEEFVDLINKIRAIDWPDDALLGPTTYNVGRLVSDNPQNILSPRLTCRIYFRTTFASDAMVAEMLPAMSTDRVSITPLGGDTPSRYLTLDGFPTTVVAFGSDAPQLRNFKHKMLCGPGSILVAHTADERISIADLEEAARNYEGIFHALKDR